MKKFTMFHQFPSRVIPGKDYKFLNPGQFKVQVSRCMQCLEKPCSQGCPCKCIPRDFIYVAAGNRPSDIDLATLLMYSQSPMSGTCGTVCPTKFCMRGCCRGKLDTPINIPGLQAELVRRSGEKGVFTKLIPKPTPTNKKVAVVGAGPAGLACAACLGSRGHSVTVFETRDRIGGDLNYVPKFRYSPKQLDIDQKFVESCGDVKFVFNTKFESEEGFDAVCWCVGAQIDNALTVPGGEAAVASRKFLEKTPEELKDKTVLIYGCGATAVDSAIYALKSGAKSVQILYRRTLAEAPLSTEERGMIDAFGVSVVQRVVITEVAKSGESMTVKTSQVDKDLKPVDGTEQAWTNADFLVAALGQKSALQPGVQFAAGQALGKPTAAIQAAASGKNAAWQIDCFLKGKPAPEIKDPLQSSYPVFEVNMEPADLSFTFNGRKIASPFVVGASTFTDRYEAARALLLAGWGGIVMKIVQGPEAGVIYKSGDVTHSFLGEQTITAAIESAKKLRQEFPDRLFIAEIDSEYWAHLDTIHPDNELQLNFDAIQINTGEQILTLAPQGNAAVYSVKNLQRKIGEAAMADEIARCPVGKTEHALAAVLGGCKSDDDALYYLKNGAMFVEFDLASLQRCGQEIQLMKGMMSHFIFSKGFTSLEDFKRASEPIDLEDVCSERLICKLTNPYVCLGCGRCTVCPNGAIDLVPSQWKYVVDPEKCTGCGLCVSRCPVHAISLVKRGEKTSGGH